MLFFNVFNPKAVTRSAFASNLYQSNLNRASFQGPRTTVVSDFFSYNGVAKVLSPITLEQSGRIHFGGTDWPAQLSSSRSPNPTDCIREGMTVQVVGRQGITLLVASVDSFTQSAA